MASTQGIPINKTQSSALDIIEQTVQRDAIKMEGNAAQDGQYWLLRSIMDLEGRLSKVEESFAEQVAWNAELHRLMEKVLDEVASLGQRNLELGRHVDSLCRLSGVSTIQRNTKRQRH